jgi:hypothetical protein
MGKARRVIVRERPGVYAAGIALAERPPIATSSLYRAALFCDLASGARLSGAGIGPKLD